MDEKNWKDYIYYLVVAVISIMSLTFLPMIGSSMTIGQDLPQSPQEWTLYITIRASASIVNILIFHSFIQQARLNVKNNERYKQAREILLIQVKKSKKPRSLRRFNAEEYSKKGGSLFVGTFFSTLVLTDAIINFSLINFLTYVFTTVITIAFGVMEMKKYEEYYIMEYYEYAVMMKEIQHDND